MIVRRRKTQSMIVGHRTTSHDRHTIVVRPSRDFNLQDNSSFSPRKHSEVVCHRTTIVRLSFDCVVRCRAIYLCFSFSASKHSEVVCHRTTIVRLCTMSHDVVRCSTISQKLSMCRKPIVSGVTTKLRLQYRSRIGENFRNLRCHPSHNVAARCDQGLS